MAIKRVVDTTKVRVKADRSGVDTGAKRVVINAFCESAVEVGTVSGHQLHCMWRSHRYSLCYVQEGVRLREKGIATDVAVVTVGPRRAQDQLRTALALGADRALHVQTDIELQPLIVAKLLAAVAGQEAPDLVLLGRQAVDTDNTQTGHILLFKIFLDVVECNVKFSAGSGQMLAGLLGWPQATFASKINVDTSKRAVVTREVPRQLHACQN